MKRALIIGLFLVLNQNMGKCDPITFPPLQPLEQNTTNESIQNYTSNNITSLPDPFVNRSNANYPDISKIEQKLFGQTYQNQNIAERLARIERTIFTTTYPDSPINQRIDNVISNFNQATKYPNISQNVLSKMESQVFNQKFTQYNPQRRIERLEEQMFGAVQSGNLEARYRALQLALKNSNKIQAAANPYNVDPFNMNSGFGTNFAGSNYTTNRGIFRKLAGAMNNPLGGTMTGFTPPIGPYNPYDNLYNNYPSGGGIYRGYRSPYGYRDEFKSYGTGTGVTILD